MSVETRELNMPPFHLEAEQYTISSIYKSINYSDSVEALNVFSKLGYKHFYSKVNQVLYQVLKTLYDSGKSCDFLTIENFIKAKELNIGDINLFQYLDSAPDIHKAQGYIELLEEKYQRRGLLLLSQKFKDYAFDETKNIINLIDSADNAISKFIDKRTDKELYYPEDVLDPLMENILLENERFKEGLPPTRVKKLRTGSDTYDNFFNGGISLTDLILIAGRPGQGKSTFLFNLLLGLAENGYVVYISSLEMSRDQIWLKLLSLKSRIHLKDLEQGKFTQEKREELIKLWKYLKTLLFIIDDDTNITPNKMKAKLRSIKNTHKDKQLVGSTDYLQLIDLDDNKNENRAQEISKITRQLKKTAKFLDIPFFALSQLSRTVEQRQDKRPKLSDLKESGGVEENADICIFVYRDEYYHPNTDKKGLAELIVGKYRNGKCGTMIYRFDGAISQFGENEQKRLF